MPRKRPGHITMPGIQRAIAMRERGMSYEAISAAMAVYEGEERSMSARHLRTILIAAGCPKKPRGVPLTGRESVRHD